MNKIKIITHIEENYPDAHILLADGFENAFLGIGQQFKIRANTATANQLPFRVTLKHQPEVKNGTFAPGDSDVEVKFKLKVN